MITPVAPFVALRSHSRVWSLILLVIDISVITAGIFLANKVSVLPLFVLIATIITLPWILGMTGTYRRSFCGSLRDEWYAIGTAIFCIIVPLMALTFIMPSMAYTRTALALFGISVFIGISLIRTFAHYSRVSRRIVLVGDTENIELVVTHLKMHSGDVILRIPVTHNQLTVIEKSIPPWMQGAFSWGATQIIITEALQPDQFLQFTKEAECMGVSIAIAPPQFRIHSYKMKLKREGDMVLLSAQKLLIFTPWAQMYKRIFDIVLSLLIIIIFFPIFALCAIAVKFETPGPIIFRQERLGKNGKPFNILKFRSMPIDAESKTGPAWANYKINRPTRVGQFLRRTSMDELPQFFNVLNGDMSLVGPRPERAYFVQRFTTNLPHYEDRLLVAPGITGWSQIGMSRMLTPDKMQLRLEGDLFYIQEWSPLLDVQILIKTFFEFLLHWHPQK